MIRWLTKHLKPRVGLVIPFIWAASIWACAMSAGCNVGPKYKKPTVRAAPAYKELTPDQFKETDGWKIAAPGDDRIRGKWWEMFKDPQLNALEEQVTVSNQNIALAVATYNASRAIVREARSQYFPTVTTSPSATVSHFPATAGRVIGAPGTGQTGAVGTASGSGSGSGGSGSGASGGGGSSGQQGGGQSTTGTGTNNVAAGGSGTTNAIYTIPFFASWEPDLWGRVRNTVAANAFGAQATEADLENVRLSMHAQLAADYFQLRGLDSQKRLVDEVVAAYQKALDLVTVLHDTGIDSGEDVALARTQLEIAKAQDIDVGILRAQFEHAIATLTGRPASSFSFAFDPLKPGPPAVPFGLPSQLLERRPDIAAAERRVAAANAEIGVAKAAYYPTLSLSGSAGLESNKLSTLLSWPSRFWSVGATLAETLFDGGLRRAVTAQARATYDETVATYRQTVLTGFQEVEDSLSSLRILSQERQQQDLAVQAADTTVQLAVERYRLGLDSYLTVVVAQQALYTNERTALTIRTEQMVSSVNLIMALGGGWDTSELPTPKAVASH
jgi:NodT family efflux transporter outer membrane factor (OMF) lipoprotein